MGQEVRVQIIDIDEYSQKISLSRRTLEQKFVQLSYKRKRYFTNKNKRIGFRTIAEALPKWTAEAKEMLEKENGKR